MFVRGPRGRPQLKRDPLGGSASISFSVLEWRPMKPYLITTGILFAVITVAHIWEAVDRGHVHHSDVLIVAVSTGLSVWAWRLLLKAAT